MKQVIRSWLGHCVCRLGVFVWFKSGAFALSPRYTKRGMCVFRCGFSFFFCLLVCMCAAVTQPLRPDPLVKSQKIALCYKVALLHGQPLIIVCILLQMLHAKKPQHKHTLGTDYDASLTRHGAKIYPFTAWITMDNVKDIFDCCWTVTLCPPVIL